MIEQRVDNGVVLLAPSDEAPTTLHLFNYTGPHLEWAKTRTIEACQFRGQVLRSTKVARKFNEEIEGFRTRLGKTEEDLVTEIRAVRTAQVVSAACLRLQDVLPAQGLQADKVWDFFRMCVRINVSFWSRLPPGGNFYISPQDGSIECMSQREGGRLWNTAIREEAKAPPVWFGSDVKKWHAFVSAHASFLYFLNPELYLTKAEGGKGSREKIQGSLGRVYPDLLPDWVFEEEALPREKVEQELAENKWAETEHMARYHKAVENHNQYVGRFLQKNVRLSARVEEWIRELFPTIPTFLEMILFLGATAGISRFKMDPEEIRHSTFQEISDQRVDYFTAQAAIVNGFIGYPCTGLGKESVALWLERKLQEGKLMGSAQEKANSELIWALRGILEDISNCVESPVQSFLREWREQHRPGFRALFYGIRPLMEILSAEDIKLLAELAPLYDGQQIEGFIWNSAELISTTVRNDPKRELSDQGVAVVGELRKHTAHWFARHYKWAFSELQKLAASSHLACINEGGIREGVQEDLSEAELVITAPHLSSEIQEMQRAIREIQRGGLDEWTLLYAPKRHFGGSLEMIEGQTLQEREQALRDYLGRHHISQTVKVGSIIRALEKIVQRPEEIEKAKETIYLDGIACKKERRGGERIYYVLDRMRQIVTFFLDVKKAYPSSKDLNISYKSYRTAIS